MAALVALRASAVGVPAQEAGVGDVNWQARPVRINSEKSPKTRRLNFFIFDPFSIIEDLQAGH
jgi:hypothetical protein